MAALQIRRRRPALVFIVFLFFMVAIPHLLLQKIHVSHHQKQVNPPQALMAETGASVANTINAITINHPKLSVDAEKMKDMDQKESVHHVLQGSAQSSHIQFTHHKLQVVNEVPLVKEVEKDQADNPNPNDGISGGDWSHPNRHSNAGSISGLNILYADQNYLNNEAKLKSMDVEMKLVEPESDQIHSKPSTSDQIHIQSIQDDVLLNLPGEDKLTPIDEMETKIMSGSLGQFPLQNEEGTHVKHLLLNATETEDLVNPNTTHGNSAGKTEHLVVDGAGSEHSLENSHNMMSNSDLSYLDYTSTQPSIHSNPPQRLKWLKFSWPKISIVHSDGPATNFSTRIDDFLNGKSSTNGNNSPCNLHFFMIWISSLSSFGPREHLSLESVFKMHPSACVIILSRSFDTPRGYQMLIPFLHRGLRVGAFAPNFQFLLKSTPAEKWFNRLARGLVDPGGIPINQNLSNLLRLAVLYKYGGIYIDSDIIVMRSFNNLSNVIGAQNVDRATGEWNRLNNAVMVFEKGNPMVLKFIKEFSQTFDGNKWGHNGPYLVSRVMKKKWLSNRYGKLCKVMEPLAFYPVDWTHMSDLFRAPKDDIEVRWASTKLMQLQQSSYTIHLWNKVSRNIEVEHGSIMDTIFHQFCLFCNVVSNSPLSSNNATSHHIVM